MAWHYDGTTRCVRRRSFDEKVNKLDITMEQLDAKKKFKPNFDTIFFYFNFQMTRNSQRRRSVELELALV